MPNVRGASIRTRARSIVTRSFLHDIPLCVCVCVCVCCVWSHRSRESTNRERSRRVTHVSRVISLRSRCATRDASIFVESPTHRPPCAHPDDPQHVRSTPNNKNGEFPHRLLFFCMHLYKRSATSSRDNDFVFLVIFLGDEIEGGAISTRIRRF